jgi:predicted Zn-dependent protease
VRKKTDQALLLARAQAFFEVGRYGAALRTCRRLLRLSPGNVDATTVAAMSLVRMNRPAEAKPLLEQGMAKGGEHQGLLSMVEALVLFHQGDAPTAARRLQEAFNTYPALNNELAAVDLLDQLLVHVADPSPSPQVVVSP